MKAFVLAAASLALIGGAPSSFAEDEVAKLLPLPSLIVVRSEIGKDLRDEKPVVMYCDFREKVTTQDVAQRAIQHCEKGQLTPVKEHEKVKPALLLRLLAAVDKFAPLKQGESNAFVARWGHVSRWGGGGGYAYGYGYGRGYGYGSVRAWHTNPGMFVVPGGYHPYTGHYGFVSGGHIHPYGYWGYGYATPQYRYYYYYNPMIAW